MSKPTSPNLSPRPIKPIPSHPPSSTIITPPPTLTNPLYSSPLYSHHSLPPPKKSSTQHPSPPPPLSFGRHYPGERPVLGSEYQPPTKQQIELLQDINEAARDKLPRRHWRGVLYKTRKGRGGGENYIDNQLPGPDEKGEGDASDEGEDGKKK